MYLYSLQIKGDSNKKKYFMELKRTLKEKGEISQNHQEAEVLEAQFRLESQILSYRYRVKLTESTAY
jgi:hypothetical protein